MMKTFKRSLSRVQATPTAHFMSKRDSFLREPGYVYPSVGLGGKEGDGDQATNESKDDEEVKEVKKVAKEVKDIQAMVKSFTSQPQELLSS